MNLTQIKGQTRPPQTEGRFEFNGLHWMTSFFKKDCSVTSKELRRVLRRSMRSAREWSLTTAGTLKLEKLIEVRNMQQDTKPKPSLLGAETAKVADLVTYQDGSIVSREIVKKPTGTVTVFAFDEGQGLSEHTAPFDALVQVLEGEVEISIAGKFHRVQGGEMILMPAQQPHALKALQRYKMILTMIRS